MEELRNQKEGKGKKINSFPYVFWTLVFVSIFLFILAFYDFFDNSPDILTCGDGTFYGACSLNKPYFCEGGLLVKNASYCGCPEFLSPLGDGCVSENYTGEKDIVLKYVVDGKENYLEMKVYAGLNAHLDTIPRSFVYETGEVARRDDFKLLKIDNEIQRAALAPLVVAIQNKAPASTDEQAKIAISAVQNILYGEPEMQNVLGVSVPLSRYPYQVLYESEGFCEDKSELLALLLRELGYGVSIFHYNNENHEAVGIKCPMKYSLDHTGYCFIETTVPAPISYSTGNYLGVAGNRLYSSPEIIVLSKGISLSENIQDYKDAKKLSRIIDKNRKTGTLNIFQRKVLNMLRAKYGLTY